MVEPAKPFACSMPECGMTFTNEDHLHVHTKKHDMVLQLGIEQKAAFVADQTPTPTRFIRNCEEVGLFQDLQNVAANPFDEGFKRAMEAKHGILSMDPTMTPSDDVLHTPQMVFPLLDGAEATLYANNQRNITISRSSSDESGTIKEFETRTISKLTNEVTTISRIVNADDLTVKHTDIHKDIETVSYKNNIIKIASNVIRKEDAKAPILIYSDSVIKDTAITSNVHKDIIDNDKLQVDKVPIMSQKSIDFVVESLTKELDCSNIPNTVVESDKTKINDVPKSVNVKKVTPSMLRRSHKVSVKKQPKLLPKKVEVKKELEDDYEVFIKLPNGKQFRMKPVEEKPDPKQALREALIKKSGQETKATLKTKSPVPDKSPVVITKLGKVPNVVKIPTGTLIPVTIVNQEGTPLSNDDLNKVPIAKIPTVEEIAKLNNVNVPNVITVNPIRTEVTNVLTTQVAPKLVTIEPRCQIKVGEAFSLIGEKRKATDKTGDVNGDISDDSVKSSNNEDGLNKDNKRTKFKLASRSAASKRYRDRLKHAMNTMYEENQLLREANDKLTSENALLKEIILEHLKKCPNGQDLSQHASRRYVSHM